MSENQGVYVPVNAKILAVQSLGEHEAMFCCALPGGKSLGHHPGQFVQVTIPTVGTAPISVASASHDDGYFEIAVRKVPDGEVTTIIHERQAGDVLGIRGPYGTGFPLDEYKGKDLLLIAGGIGLFPLRSLIQAVLNERDQYGDVTILFGTNSPEERYFPDELEAWDRRPDVTLLETVVRPNKEWQGRTGLITTLFKELDVHPSRTVAVVVGPPIMYKFVCEELVNLRIPEEQTWVSLERNMHCAINKCGHCQIGPYYCCEDGPVFRLDVINAIPGAI